MGPKHQSAIATLVERQNRIVRLVRLTSADSETLRDELIDRMCDLPPHLLRSISRRYRVAFKRWLNGE